MKKITILVIMLCSVMAARAQKNADWQKSFPSSINWYKITDAGVLIVATKDGLYGLTPEGQEVWKDNEIENIKEENVEPIDGTPYIALVKPGMLKSNTKVLDVMSGKVLINSQELGFVQVSKRIYLPQSNSMLFSGPKAGRQTITLVDLNTGKQMWTQEKVFEKATEQLVSKPGEAGDAIFIATDKRIYKLNRATGDILLTIDMKSDLPLSPESKESGFAGLGKSFSKVYGGGGKDALAIQTSTSADFFQTDDKSKIYFWNQDNFTQFEVATGRETWTRFSLPSPIAYILRDSRGLLIATSEKRQEDIAKANSGGKGLMGGIAKRVAAGKNRAALLLLEPVTGKPKWQSEDVDLKGDVLAYKLTGNKLIFGTQLDRGDNYISIVDLDAGKSVTKKPIKIDGEIRDLQLMPQGLYFRTSEEINIVDLESGNKNWKKGFKVKNCLGYNEDANTGYVYGNGKVYKVDFQNGELNEWLTSLDFKRSEEPTSLSIHDGRIFISSDQNAALYDKNGKLMYHTYVEAPGRTMAGKILSGLGGAASLAMGAAAAGHSAQLSYAKGYYGSTDPNLDASIKNSQNIANAGFASAVAGFQSINKRFSATKQANGFIAMLTKYGTNQGKDAGITIVNKSDGKRVSDMLLGDKKDPDYKIDELGRVVYYNTDGNSLEGFKF